MCASVQNGRGIQFSLSGPDVAPWLVLLCRQQHVKQCSGQRERAFPPARRKEYTPETDGKGHFRMSREAQALQSE
jgi:hypothetical protein